MFKTALTIVIAGACALHAGAQITRNWIYQHNTALHGSPPNQNYEIVQEQNRVDIYVGDPNQTFEFEACTEEWDGQAWVNIGPGDINLIAADQDAGVVMLTILYHLNETYGAQNVKQIDLGATGVTGAISSIYLAGSLGVDGNTEADSAINTWRVEAGIYHDIVVEQFDGTITCPELNGDLYAWGEGPHTGHLDLWHGRVHSIHLNGSLASSGFIEAGGGLDGTIHVGSDLGGSGIHLDGYMQAGSVIEVGNDITGPIAIAGASGEGGTRPVISAGGALSSSLDVTWHLDCELSFARVESNGAIRVGALYGGDLTGSLTVTGDTGDLNGWVTVNGDASAPIEVGHDLGDEGGISVQGDLSAHLTIAGDVYPSFLGPTASIYVGGDATGLISVAGDVMGDAEFHEYQGLYIDGDVTTGIHVGGDLGATVHIGGELSGLVEVLGEADSSSIVQVGVTGAADLTGELHFYHDLAGTVRVYGDLRDPGLDGPCGHIIVDGGFPATGQVYIDGALEGTTTFVCIDYDGYDAADDWDPSACVCVGTNPQQCYYANAPQHRIYRVTCQKGDLTNDSLVSAFDIDPFVLVLTEWPECPGYQETLPGLWGSRTYHADMNCNGAVNAFDVDPFVLRLTNPPAYYAAWPGCEECPAPDNFEQSPPNDDDSSSPAAVAALLRDNVAPERLSVVIEIAAELASAYADTPRGEFWAAVLAELE